MFPVVRVADILKQVELRISKTIDRLTRFHGPNVPLNSHK